MPDTGRQIFMHPRSAFDGRGLRTRGYAEEANLEFWLSAVTTGDPDEIATTVHRCDPLKESHLGLEFYAKFELLQELRGRKA
jgi:hypothetical protein